MGTTGGPSFFLSLHLSHRSQAAEDGLPEPPARPPAPDNSARSDPKARPFESSVEGAVKSYG